MNNTEKRKIQLHKQELDEKYLSRKLTEMVEKLPTITLNLKLYKQNLMFEIKANFYSTRKRW